MYNINDFLYIYRYYSFPAYICSEHDRKGIKMENKKGWWFYENWTQFTFNNKMYHFLLNEFKYSANSNFL